MFFPPFFLIFHTHSLARLFLVFWLVYIYLFSSYKFLAVHRSRASPATRVKGIKKKKKEKYKSSLSLSVSRSPGRSDSD